MGKVSGFLFRFFPQGVGTALVSNEDGDGKGSEL